MASLRSTIDGLGGEELGQPGSQVSDVWVTGSVISDSLISGANIYSTGTVQGENVYGDTTVSGATVKGTTISGTSIGGVTISGTTAVLTTISGATVNATTITNDEGTLKSVSIGSATATRFYGAVTQAGSGQLSADSGAWVVFPEAYSNIPIVQVTNWTTVGQDVNVLIGSLNVGSAFIEGETASDEFGWSAIGI